MATETYRDQVRLLLDVLPLVMEEAIFALKGGTAINLFEWDMPRLSVDIDLTYLPTQGREESLAAISSALDRVAANIERRLAPSKVTKPAQGGEQMEVKLNCQRQRTQVKIEVNPTLRGHLMPVRVIPTPRWTLYDAVRYKVAPPKGVPLVTQERIYSSPIWYEPNS